MRVGRQVAEMLAVHGFTDVDDHVRAAFDAALKEPELLDAAKKGNLEINPKSGAEVAAQIKSMYSAPKEVVERMGRVARP